MGTIAHAYGSGAQSAMEGLFSNLVTLSRVDGVVDEAEVAMLERVAERLSLTKEQAKEIIRHPEDFPMVPPVAKEERFERLIQFVDMAFADGVVDESEAVLVSKYGIALGFTDEDAHKHTEAILDLLIKGTSSDDILKSLM